MIAVGPLVTHSQQFETNHSRLKSGSIRFYFFSASNLPKFSKVIKGEAIVILSHRHDSGYTTVKAFQWSKIVPLGNLPRAGAPAWKG